MAIAFLVATPLLFLTITTQNQTLLIFSLISAAFFMTWYYGPMVAFIQDIVPVSLRATAFAVYLFMVHIIGSTPAPAVIGKISDLTDLQTACLLMPVTNLLGAIFLFITTYLLIKNKGSEKNQID
jgi:MFS family permease